MSLIYFVVVLAACASLATGKSSCRTPSGGAGECISIKICQPLKDLVLTKDRTPEEVDLLKKSECGYQDDAPAVCCPKKGGQAGTSCYTPEGNPGKCISLDTCTYLANMLKPSGETPVSDVNIDYVKKSSRRVRLGEYDISHEGPDCAEVEAGGQDCTDGAIRILIEKTILHPEFDPVHGHKAHDIALIRLQEMAPFTDFIRPICMPINDLTLPENIPQDFIMYVAGWGAVNSSVSYSNIKVHVDLPYVDQEKCQVAYGMPGRSVKLGAGHICAGGIDGKDSCKGDNGGPLMSKTGGSYEVIGITSFGPVPCGLEGVPGVYTKIYEYIYWIMTTIEL